MTNPEDRARIAFADQCLKDGFDSQAELILARNESPGDGCATVLAAMLAFHAQQRLAEAPGTTTAPVEGETPVGVTQQIAGQLNQALVDRDVGRFNAVAFVYRHEILAALATPSPSAAGDREAIVTAMRQAFTEERSDIDGGWVGDLLEFGCAEANYTDPEGTATALYVIAADAILALATPSASVPERSGMREALARIANAVTANREGSAPFHDGCEAIVRECVPIFVELGMSNEGDGWGFDQ